MIYFVWRWTPVAQYMHSLIESGYLGGLYDCHFERWGGHFLGNGYAWRSDPERALGVLGDLGSHLIDMARWYLGDVTSVSAHMGRFVDRKDAAGQPTSARSIDSAALLVEFENGTQTTIKTSGVAHEADRGTADHVVLHGALGKLESEFTFRGSDPAEGITRMEASLWGARKDDASFRELEIPNGFSGEADASSPFDMLTKYPVGDRLFIDAILEGKQVRPNFEDGLRVQQIMQAAIESHETGKSVSLD